MLQLASRWFALPLRERVALAGLMTALPAMALVLRVLGYGRARRLVDAWTAPPGALAPTARDMARASRLADLADIAGRRGPLAAACLPQALLVYGLLRRRGFEPAIELGARKDGESFGAHAWVVLDGRALGSGPAGHAAFPAHS